MSVKFTDEEFEAEFVLRGKEKKKADKKAEKERTKYHMYKEAGCAECNGKGFKRNTGDFGMVISIRRCGCSLIKTKRFKEAEVSETITQIKFKKFYDNNSKCNSKSFTDRSW